MNLDQQPEWVKYWHSVAPKLENYLSGQRIAEIEAFLTASFGYFSYITEDLSPKITQHKDLVRGTYPLVIQLQDILRANIHNQQFLLLSPSAFNLRASFEIRTNLRFIYQHQEPTKMIQRLNDFAMYEELIGKKNSPNIESPSTEVEAAFANQHPYWGKGKELKDNAKWNGEGKSMKDLCKILEIMDEYHQIFSLTSKFVHGSPVVRNLYNSPQG